MISGDRSAYTYLPKSVARFFRPAQLGELMGAVGFDWREVSGFGLWGRWRCIRESRLESAAIALRGWLAGARFEQQIPHAALRAGSE